MATFTISQFLCIRNPGIQPLAWSSGSKSLIGYSQGVGEGCSHLRLKLGEAVSRLTHRLLARSSPSVGHWTEAPPSIPCHMSHSTGQLSQSKQTRNVREGGNKTSHYK